MQRKKRRKKSKGQAITSTNFQYTWLNHVYFPCRHWMSKLSFFFWNVTCRTKGKYTDYFKDLLIHVYSEKFVITPIYKISKPPTSKSKCPYTYPFIPLNFHSRINFWASLRCFCQLPTSKSTIIFLIACLMPLIYQQMFNIITMLQK